MATGFVPKNVSIIFFLLSRVRFLMNTPVYCPDKPGNPNETDVLEIESPFFHLFLTAHPQLQVLGSANLKLAARIFLLIYRVI